MTRNWSNSKGKTIISVGSAAAYRAGSCETNEFTTLGSVGFYGIGQMNPASEGPEAARDFADAMPEKTAEEILRTLRPAAN